MCVAGMNKMVINYLDKLFVTSDAATMLSEMEVQHPAAKMIVLAAKAQEAELGDGTNLVRRPPLRTPPLCSASPPDNGLHVVGYRCTRLVKRSVIAMRPAMVLHGAQL